MNAAPTAGLVLPAKRDAHPAQVWLFPGKPKKVYNGQSQYARIVLDFELT
jgi:hypothetical protein